MEEKRKARVILIGDGPIFPDSPFAVFRWKEDEEEKVYLADYTEYGLHAQERISTVLKNKGISYQFEDIVPLEQALEKIPEDAELSAPFDSYYERYLSDKGIRSVKELKKALAEGEI